MIPECIRRLPFIQEYLIIDNISVDKIDTDKFIKEQQSFNLNNTLLEHIEQMEDLMSTVNNISEELQTLSNRIATLENSHA